jgi:hypothetical protein
METDEVWRPSVLQRDGNCFSWPEINSDTFEVLLQCPDPLCGLVFRVPGYRSRGLGFGSRRYQIFWEVVGLERVSLSLVRIIQELLVRKSLRWRWPRDTLYPLKLALTSPTSGGRSVGIVRLRTKSTDFFLFYCSALVLKNLDVSQNCTHA